MPKEQEQQRRLKRAARQPMKSARDPLGAMANAAGETTGQRETEERDRKQEMVNVHRTPRHLTLQSSFSPHSVRVSVHCPRAFYLSIYQNDSTIP